MSRDATAHEEPEVEQDASGADASDDDASDDDASDDDASDDDASDDAAAADEVTDETTDGGATTEPATEPTADWAERPRVLRLVVGALVLGVLLGAAGLLVPRWQAGSGDAAAQASAVDAANQFVVDINTYDSADVQEYQSRMRPQLTRGGARDFDALTSGLFPSLQGQQLVSRDAQVVGSAVDTIDGDSASVLAAANASIVRGDQSPGEYPTRWRIDLRRGGDGWTVASWEVVGSRSNNGQPAVPGQATPSAAAPSATPSPSPSTGAGQ